MGLLLILAWSSVAFNLPAVYQPVTRMLFGSEASPPPRPLSAVTGAPKLGWREAHEAAIRAMAEEARRYGFSVKSERLMFYNPGDRTYAYRVRSSLDVGRYGNTQITINADDGHRLSVTRPTGAGTGATVTTWIEDIHTAGVFGRPMQIVITITGLGVALLSITGVLIYLRKLKARLA